MKHLLVMSLFLAAAAPAWAQDEPVEQPADGSHMLYLAPRLGIWMTNLNGRIESDQGVDSESLIEGTSLSFDEELDMEDSRTVPYVQVLLMEQDDSGPTSRTSEILRVLFMMTEYEGDTELEDAEIFNGVYYGAGATVESSFRFWMLGADYTVVDRITPGRFSGDMFVGFRVWDAELTVETAAGRNDERLRLGLIGLGVSASWQFNEKFGFEARSGGYLSLWSEDSFLEAEDCVGAHYEGEFAMTFSLPHVRARLGLSMLAAAAALAREDSHTAEEDDWSFFMGGPFLDVSAYF